MKKIFFQFISILLIQLFLITNQGFCLAMSSGFQGTAVLIDIMKKKAELLQAQQRVKTKSWTDILKIRTFNFFYTQQGKIEKVVVVTNNSRDVAGYVSTEISSENVKIDIPEAKANEVFLMDWEKQGVWVDFIKESNEVVIKAGLKGAGAGCSRASGQKKVYDPIETVNFASVMETEPPRINSERALESYRLTKFFELNALIEKYKNILESNPELAEKLNPNLSDIYFERGKILAAQKKYNEAIEDCKMAIDLKPVWEEEETVIIPILADACFERGKILLKQKKYTEAIKDFLESKTLKSELTERANEFLIYAYLNRGVVELKETKEYEHAVDDFTCAIELNSKNASSYWNRGIANDFLGKSEDTILQDFSMAIQLNPREAFYYKNRGDYFKNKRRYESAIANYQKAMELDPALRAELSVKLAEMEVARKIIPEFTIKKQESKIMDGHYKAHKIMRHAA